MTFAINKAQHLRGDVDGENIISSDRFLLAGGVTKVNWLLHSRIGEETRASDSANLRVEPPGTMSARGKEETVRTDEN